jgi:transposase
MSIRATDWLWAEACSDKTIEHPTLARAPRKFYARAWFKRSRRGDKGRDDKKFLSALHYFVVHNITWRALPAEFGNWNSVWKRFWRLSQSGVFEAFFEALAAGGQQAQTVRPPKLLGSRRVKWINADASSFAGRADPATSEWVKPLGGRRQKKPHRSGLSLLRWERIRPAGTLSGTPASRGETFTGKPTNSGLNSPGGRLGDRAGGYGG